MQVIQTQDELMQNVATLDEYLADSQHRGYALGLIKRGTCFVAISAGAEVKFYPSRFIGYENNSYSMHETNQSKDGRITKQAISMVLQCNPEPNDTFDVEYKKHCLKLGIVPNAKGSFGVQRKYWVLSKK